jgi:hypothetical protein
MRQAEPPRGRPRYGPSTEQTRASYDAVAEAYATAFSDELAGKPLDRALLDGFAELCRRER